ncbi:VOC family protein [Roseicyclus persicicus]|uniref:Glyoxalase n=1 Tax=Roseicyclus persicicus TaxID=2650661 RepID=A0A7X6GYY9_9RHOB|nr:VOC family protein [Roseibacterium persicicum]NKX44972.1 glyoxalase [Roseibacterium persicicum]
MDYETVPAPDLGRSLTGIGLNLLTRDVRGLAGFLAGVMGLAVHRLSDDFGLVRHGGMTLQIHADRTFARHPLPGLIPENPPRGGGVQVYLFGIDPDAAIARAEAAGHVVLEPAADKPHGLREGTILSPEGYAFSPAVALP